MPRPAEWTRHIDRALAEIDTLTCPTLDRRAIEQLLGVSPRQAVRILHQLAGHQAGQALVISRGELHRKLTELKSDARVQFERARHSRAVQELAQSRSALAARLMPIPAPARPDSAGLPQNIRLRPGRLEISFTSGEELLTCLLEFAQAVAADIDRFQGTIHRQETL